MKKKSGLAKSVDSAGMIGDFYVCDGGRIEQIVGGHVTNPMIHDFYDVECCIRGEVFLYINEKTYRLTQGDLYIIPPQTVHHKRFSADSSAAAFICITGKSFDQYLNVIGMSSQNVVFSKKLTPKAITLLEDTLDSLEVASSLRINIPSGPRYVEQIRNKTFSDYGGIEAAMRTSACLNLFLAELLRIYGQTAKPMQRRTIQQEYVDSAVRFIEANYHLDIGVQSVADYIGIDRSYLFTLLREEMGISVRDYLIRYRMKVACDFLRQPGVTIKWVANSVGYETCSFSRIFKKVMGITPAEYQQTHQNG